MLRKTKPRRLATLVRNILDEDPRATYELRDSELYVRFRSSLAWSNLREDLDIPVVKTGTVDRSDLPPGERAYFVIWDIRDLGMDSMRPSVAKPFTFDGSTEAKEARDRVGEQEDRTADLIGGHRHVGSGAIDDLKSDASSELWQAESKQTRARSFSVKLEMLEKIHQEARTQGKRPMVHLLFTDVPNHMTVCEEWVMVPAPVFEKMVGVERIFNEGDDSDDDLDSRDDDGYSE